jgi:hypothetical protein
MSLDGDSYGHLMDRRIHTTDTLQNLGSVTGMTHVRVVRRSKGEEFPALLRWYVEAFVHVEPPVVTS